MKTATLPIHHSGKTYARKPKHVTTTRNYVKPSPGMQMAITRVGSFHVVPSPDSPHCGPAESLNNDGTLTINYSVAVECNYNSLDSRGFLFDQLTVDQYFQGVTTCDVSCEVLAIESLRGLLTAIREENPYCEILHMSISLQPNPEAHISVEWARPGAHHVPAA